MCLSACHPIRRSPARLQAVHRAHRRGHHVNRGYIYFAMAFSRPVELMNMRFRKKTRSTRVT